MTVALNIMGRIVFYDTVFPVRRQRYDYDPGFHLIVRMQYPEAALL